MHVFVRKCRALPVLFVQAAERIIELVEGVDDGLNLVARSLQFGLEMPQTRTSNTVSQQHENEGPEAC